LETEGAGPQFGIEYKAGQPGKGVSRMRRKPCWQERRRRTRGQM